MAKHVGMDRSFISDPENGRKEVSIRNLELLATAFGMTVSKLSKAASQESNRFDPPDELPEIVTTISDSRQIRAGCDFPINRRRCWQPKMREHLREYVFVLSRVCVRDLNVQGRRGFKRT